MSAELRERLAALPGMERVLGALEGLAPAYAVGGAVRDLLLGRPHLDIDVAVEGDAIALARELQARLGGEAVEHERFGTASVRLGELELDIAGTRRETYAHPGALPEVEPAPLAEDLRRRDFTINAMALGLTGEDAGVLHDPHGGRADLDAGLMRVLHPRSFEDDPTRLLRAVRYAARFGFALEPETERLARDQAAGAGLSTVSGSRVRDELLDLLGERELRAALELLARLGIDRALDPRIAAEPALAERARDAAAQVGADPALTALAALILPDPDGLAGWVEALHLGRGRSAAVLRAARKAPALARSLRPDLSPSAVHALLHCEPLEALGLAIALGAPTETVLAYVGKLRDVRLEIDGADLLAAGVPEGPAVGRALAEVLRLKLDGVVAGRDQELAAAVEAARQWQEGA